VSSTQYCRSGQCAFRAKTCLFDCSGHGTCRAQNIATRLGLDSCLINDVTCTAQCECSESYSGTTCAISPEEILARRKTRTQMIEVIQNTSAITDVTRDSILELVGLVSELGATSVELTAESCMKLLTMLTNVLSNADTLEIKYDDIGSVYNVADTCAMVAERVDTEDKSTVDSITQLISDVIQQYLAITTSNLVVGQEAVQFMHSLSRSSAAIQNSLAGFSVDIPLSDWERAIGMQASTVNMSGLASEALSSTLAVRAVELPPRSFSNGSLFNSNPIQIEVTKIGSAEQNLNKIIVVLQNREQHEFGTFNASNTNFTTICFDGDVSWHNYSCPEGGQVSHKCTGYAGALDSTCPPFAILPTCPVLIDGVPVMNDACTVIEFSSYSTTCECSLSLQTSRRLTEAESTTEDTYETSGAVEVVSMTLYSYEEFIDTIYETQSVQVSDLKNAILVICMFAIL
jgi:hypothetical protein